MTSGPGTLIRTHSRGAVLIPFVLLYEGSQFHLTLFTLAETTLKTRLLIATILGLASGGVPSEAGMITYTYSTELVEISPSANVAGLHEATITVNAMFSSTDVYYNDGYGYPLVAADLGATYTISGASVLANNGTFAFPTAIVYDPETASLLSETASLQYPGSSYSNPLVTLSDGYTLEMNLSTVETAFGGAVIVGETISPLDFGPTISQDDSLASPERPTSLRAVLLDRERERDAFSPGAFLARVIGRGGSRRAVIRPVASPTTGDKVRRQRKRLSEASQ